MSKSNLLTDPQQPTDSQMIPTLINESWHENIFQTKCTLSMRLQRWFNWLVQEENNMYC